MLAESYLVKKNGGVRRPLKWVPISLIILVALSDIIFFRWYGLLLILPYAIVAIIIWYFPVVGGISAILVIFWNLCSPYFYMHH
jgi:hypothetical protein